MKQHPWNWQWKTSKTTGWFGALMCAELAGCTRSKMKWVQYNALTFSFQHLFLCSVAASEAPAAAARSQHPARCSAPLLSPSLLLTHTVVNASLRPPPLSPSLTKSIHSHRISRRRREWTRQKEKCLSSLNAAALHDLSPFSLFMFLYASENMMFFISGDWKHH